MAQRNIVINVSETATVFNMFTNMWGEPIWVNDWKSGGKFYTWQQHGRVVAQMLV